MESVYLSFLNFNWTPLKDYLGKLAFGMKDAYILERINRFCICPTDGPIVDNLLLLMYTIKTSPHEEFRCKHGKEFLQQLPSEIKNFYHQNIPNFSNNIYQVLRTIYQNSEKNIKFKLHFSKEYEDKKHTLIYCFCKLFPEAAYIVTDHVRDFINYVSYDVFAHFYDFVYVIYSHIKHWTVCIRNTLYRFIRISAFFIYNGYYEDGIFSLLNDFDEVLQDGLIEKRYFLHDSFQPQEFQFKTFCMNFWPFEITLSYEINGDQYPMQMKQLGALLIDAAFMLNIDPFVFEYAMGYSNRRLPPIAPEISVHDPFAIPWRIAETLDKGYIQFPDKLEELGDTLIYFDTFGVGNPEWMFECFECPDLVKTLQHTYIHDRNCQVINMRKSVLLQGQDKTSVSKFVVFNVDLVMLKESVDNFSRFKQRTQELYFLEYYSLFKAYYYNPLVDIWNKCSENDRLTFINIVKHIFPSAYIMKDFKNLWIQFYRLDEDLYSYLYSFVVCFTRININQLPLMNPSPKSSQIKHLEKLKNDFSALGKFKPLTKQCLQVYQIIYDIQKKLQQDNITEMDDCTMLLRKQYNALFKSLLVF